VARFRMTLDGRRLRRREQRVYEVFLRYPGCRFYGPDVFKLASVWLSGYPELWSLEDAGWIASEWEDPRIPYPRRRVYWLVDAGPRPALLQRGWVQHG
jgi:hypothetical protein